MSSPQIFDTVGGSAAAQDEDVVSAAVQNAVQNKRRRRSCDCGSADACFACGRCLEQHCVCGLSVRSLLCRESHPCNCRVHEPTMRCTLCFGCRQPSSDRSHCRCVQHQLVSCLDPDELKSVEGYCKCHQRTTKQREPSAESRAYRHRRLTSITRRTGIPSSQGVYASKVKDPRVTVDHLGESGEEASEPEDADDASAPKPTNIEELETVLPPFSLFRTQKMTTEAPPQRLVPWSRTSSYQESIDPSATSFVKTDGGLVLKLSTTTATRAVENATFAHAHRAALPSEDIIDYVVTAASLKTSRMPELIGSFENTAAVAVGIVLEEYTQQLVTRSERETMCVSSKRNVQDFAALVLHEFNYALYLSKRELPSLHHLSSEQALQLEDELVQLVFGEFAAVQCAADRASLSSAAVYNQVCLCIREVVAEEIGAARDVTQSTVTTAAEEKDNTPCINAVKLSRRPSKLTGQFLYKYELAANLGAKHHASVSIDGFESQYTAERSIKRMKKALQDQDTRLDAIENPRPPPEDPIITELYAQLLRQVQESRAKQSATESPQ